jgi:hypothetical protein
VQLRHRRSRRRRRRRRRKKKPFSIKAFSGVVVSSIERKLKELDGSGYMAAAAVAAAAEDGKWHFQQSTADSEMGDQAAAQVPSIQK